MSELTLEEGMKAFCEDMEREIREDWGKWLTEDEHDAVMHALASFAAEELEFLEKAWCIENQDRLEIQIRGLVEDILRDPHGRVNAFVMADGIADASANVFNQIKIRIGDDPENEPNAVIVEAKVEENDRSDAEGFVEFTIATDDIDFQVYYPRVDPIEPEQDAGETEIGSGSYDENVQDAAMTGDQSADSVMEEEEEEEEEMSDNNFCHSLAVSDQNDDQDMVDHGVVDEDGGGDSLVSHQAGSAHRLTEGMTDDVPDADYMADNAFVTEEMAHDAHISRGATPTDKEEGQYHDYSSDAIYSPAIFQPTDLQGGDDSDSDYVEEPQVASTATEKKGMNKAASQSRYENDLWFVIMDEEKPNGCPKYYKCKIPSCNGFQGGWNGRHRHFQAKHPEEWFATTGSRPKLFECSVDDCDYSTVDRRSINNHRKNHHGLGPVESKK